MLLDIIIRDRLIIKNQLTSSRIIDSHLALYNEGCNVSCMQMIDTSVLDSFHVVHVSACC
jgi:hypothetical protein